MIKDLGRKRNKFNRQSLRVMALVAVTLFMSTQAKAADLFLTASWYAEKDLKSSGQWAITGGVCADGSVFDENALTCATRDFNLGDYLLVTNISNNKSVRVKVTDRINKRFKGKRIDLTKRAFGEITGNQWSLGLVKVKVEKEG